MPSDGRRPFPIAVVALLAWALCAPAGAATRVVRAGDSLQAALDEASAGDVILLEAGATFTGNFVLPVKTGSDYITVRSSTDDSLLPGEGSRISPADAPRLARVVSNSSLSAIRTAPGAHHWRLQFLELPANPKGYGEILSIGDGSSEQHTPEAVPYAIVIDRVYIHGDPLVGQKRGIALNGRDVTIRGCYIGDIKAVGQDSQAIGGWNGPGPYLVENNYLEAAAENFLLGGSDPSIPGLVTENVVFRRNYVSRPVTWRDPIVPTPGGLSASASSDGGLLPGGTYAYRVVARRPSGQTNVARSTASAEVSASVPPGAVAGSVTVTWTTVPDATEYYVYGRTAGGQSAYWRVTANTFTDTGDAGTAGAPPTSIGTRWTVKNLFELKNARNVVVEYNTFENNWEAGQAGYAIVFTPRNQDGACTWCVVENVQFNFNIVRHVAAAINILGYDDENPSQQTRQISIRHNLVYGVSKALWGGTGFFLLLGDEPRDIVVDHNTVVHNGTTIVYAYGGPEADPREVYGFQFTNNLVKHNSYGIWSSYFAYGMEALGAYYPGAIVQGNLLAGGSAVKYPGGNYFYSDFAGQFVNLAGDDYRLAASSPLLGAAADGTNVGADVATVLAGQPGATPPPPEPLPSPARPSPPKNVRVVKTIS